MAQSIPAFVQYQQPMIPLRGLWNRPPPEGDYFHSVEIDWNVSPPGSCVQFQLAGNSPVAISQIVALSVDNSSSGADVEFIFPDSGWKLVVPARAQGIFPVSTNALMFYANSPNSQPGDVTIFLIHNSNPPPVPVPITSAQNSAATGQIGLADGSAVVIPASISGTLNSASIVVNPTAGSALGVIVLTLEDGTGRVLWQTAIELPAGSTQTIPINLTGLALRFRNGLNLVLSGASNIGGYVIANAYYSVP